MMKSIRCLRRAEHDRFCLLLILGVCLTVMSSVVVCWESEGAGGFTLEVTCYLDEEMTESYFGEYPFDRVCATVTLPTDVPTRTGCAFMGWRDVDSGTIYQPGHTFTNSSSLSISYTMVALWIPEGSGSGTMVDPYSGSYGMVVDWENDEPMEDEISFYIEEGTSFTLVNDSYYTLAYGPFYSNEDGDIFFDGNLTAVVSPGEYATTTVTKTADEMIVDQNGDVYELMGFGVFPVQYDSYSGLWYMSFGNYVTVKPMPAGMAVHAGTELDPIVDNLIVYITEEMNGTTLFCDGYPKDVVFVNLTDRTLSFDSWDDAPSGPTISVPSAELITSEGYLVGEIIYYDDGTGHQIRSWDSTFYVLFGAVPSFPALVFLSDPIVDGSISYGN